MTDPDHAGTICRHGDMPRRFRPQPLTISVGEFYLFVKDPEQFNVRYMRYVGRLTATNYATYYFEGYKTVHNDPGFDVWSDTTTLFVTVYAGMDNTGAIVGKGIIEIHLKDLRASTHHDESD